MVTIALYNLKGGVGKTAATINLAYLAAKEGYKTLVWDLDPQGSSSFYLGVNTTIKNEAKKISGRAGKPSSPSKPSKPGPSKPSICKPSPSKPCKGGIISGAFN